MRGANYYSLAYGPHRPPATCCAGVEINQNRPRGRVQDKPLHSQLFALRRCTPAPTIGFAASEPYCTRPRGRFCRLPGRLSPHPHSTLLGGGAARRQNLWEARRPTVGILAHTTNSGFCRRLLLPLARRRLKTAPRQGDYAGTFAMSQRKMRTQRPR